MWGGQALVDVPLLRSDVHDLAGLGEIAETIVHPVDATA